MSWSLGIESGPNWQFTGFVCVSFGSCVFFSEWGGGGVGVWGVGFGVSGSFGLDSSRLRLAGRLNGDSTRALGN